MKSLNVFLIGIISLAVSLGFSADDHKSEPKKVETHSEKEKDEHGHDHENESKESEKEEAEHAHSEGEEHGEHDEHAGHGEGEEEASTTIGPDKGIIEKAEAGFKLSPEAIKTMALKTQPFKEKTFTLPLPALVQIKDEKFLYRLRDSWFKRIKVQVTKKQSDSFTAQSSNLRDGDQIVTDGTGFLRITEIFAEEGASHGHSH